METFDHIIIGGGALGLSIAFHLVRDTRHSVLVLERNDLASAASSKAAGLILQATSKPFHTPLASQTRKIIPTLEDLLGDKTGFHNVGSLRVAGTPSTKADLATLRKTAARHDIPFHHLTPSEAQEKAPWLTLQPTDQIICFPTDGYIDPFLFSTTFGRAARKLGATIRTRTAVTDLIIHANQVIGVKTTSGDIQGGSVIDAAGAWASLISARAGYPLPMAPTRSHYWITAPDRAYGGTFPVTLLPDAKAYMRPEVGGMVLGVQELKSATFDARQLPDDINTFSPTTGEDHWDILIDAFEPISKVFPRLPEAAFTSYVSGLSTYTPDGTIVLGQVPGPSGLYAASGCCGYGITLSAGIGSAMTALVQGETPAFDMTPFAVDRFGPVDPFSRTFQTQCAAARAVKSRK